VVVSEEKNVLDGFFADVDRREEQEDGFDEEYEGL
jgi:hypothetical protein